jgi:glycosyltransferase involved in cell wall biosynthesis
MKILFLNHNIAWKGGFFRAFHWGRFLVRKGHEVTIITISEKNKLNGSYTVKDGVTIIKSPDLLSGKLRTGWDFWDLIWRMAFLSRKRYDIVHCIDTRPVVIIPGLFMKYIKKSKLVLDWGDWWGKGGTITERNGGLMEKIFAPLEVFFEEKFRVYADWNITLTQVLKDRAIKLGLDESKISIVRHGADIEGVVPLNKLMCREKLQFSKNERIIGYVGTIFPVDFEILLEAFKNVLRDRQDYKLLMIGNCKIEPPPEMVNSGHIIFTGILDLNLMLEYIGACDFMLLPLKNTVANAGRWPSKVCDYLAAGKPVITTQVGDIFDLFKDEKAGFSCDDNSLSFANKIKDAFDNVNTLPVLEKNARDIAEKSLSWAIHTDKLETIYKRLT